MKMPYLFGTTSVIAAFEIYTFSWVSSFKCARKIINFDEKNKFDLVVEAVLNIILEWKCLKIYRALQTSIPFPLRNFFMEAGYIKEISPGKLMELWESYRQTCDIILRGCFYLSHKFFRVVLVVVKIYVSCWQCAKQIQCLTSRCLEEIAVFSNM